MNIEKRPSNYNADDVTVPAKNSMVFDDWTVLFAAPQNSYIFGSRRVLV